MQERLLMERTAGKQGAEPDRKQVGELSVSWLMLFAPACSRRVRLVVRGCKRFISRAPD